MSYGIMHKALWLSWKRRGNVLIVLYCVCWGDQKKSSIISEFVYNQSAAVSHLPSVKIATFYLNFDDYVSEAKLVVLRWNELTWKWKNCWQYRSFRWIRSVLHKLYFCKSAITMILGSRDEIRIHWENITLHMICKYSAFQVKGVSITL